MHLNKILIVDDYQDNCLLLQTYLNKAGYNNVKAIQTAVNILAEVERYQPELVLMDIMMPDVDGILAVSMLRKHWDQNQLPIIMVTAAGEQRYLKEAFEMGANDYVNKPVKRVEFLARVKSAIEIKKQYDKIIEYQERIQADIDLAKSIQKGLLPMGFNSSHIEIAAQVNISESLSGDLFYWEELSDGKLAVILIDIMGHGISASLVGMSLRSLLSAEMREHQKPEALFKNLNSKMYSMYNEADSELGELGYYFTSIYMLIDSEQKTFTYCNAGHPPGFMFAGAAIRQLDEGCLPIGMFAEISPQQATISYNAGDVVVLFSDGLFEVYLGEDDTDRDFTTFASWTAEQIQADAKTTMQQLMEPVQLQSQSVDDATVIVIKFK